jgi:hypothetical protein
MARKYSVDSVLSDAEQIARVWTENPTFTLGEIKLTTLQKMMDDLRDNRSQLESLRTRITALVNETDEQANALGGVVTRAKSGFRAVYGPNSTQYEQAGGTRQSERKRPTPRKKKTEG